ncbi:MAG TPA: SDR family oxidoreductase [Candidatus Paceibacterota bacterium]|nr:SDR family oxidoreductase [Verrucomicrobiota bacterium]HOX02853.1 SDR family oxidoreductase [Verrucomicrobiota bacterium]HRZ45605.1 SDR family oxidoreductase [Candidatus Paceibacterota bacterium]HRZ91392.1 SDR family oxidoreductase [Candidatus Paceibacterota bacterium]
MRDRRPTAWVTGAGGLIGSHLVRTAAACMPGWRVIALTRDRLDLTDEKAVRDLFAHSAPQSIIHCAALSRSPACQADPALASRLNVDVTVHLARLAEAQSFLFFSTDLVFDGRKGWYVESDPVNPLGVYAETKARAEEIVHRNPGHTVIRTSLNGGVSPSGDRGFNEQLRQAWRAGQVPRLFTDEYRCPLAAEVTARAVWELVQAGRSGLYHLAGSARLSRFEIGKLVAQRCPELNPRFEAASLLQYEGAPRAPDTSLDCGRVQACLSFRLPGLAEWLAAHPEAPF